MSKASMRTQGEWDAEPLDERHGELTVHTARPFNAEPSNTALQQLITPKGDPLLGPAHRFALQPPRFDICTSTINSTRPVLQLVP